LKPNGLRSINTAEIVERVLKGDAEAFNLLVRQWQKPLYNFICRLVGDREEAMDLCQESFMKAYRELPTLKDRDRFSSWLYRIAHNACYTRLRKDMGRVYVEIDPSHRPTEMGVECQLSVEKALKHLPDEQREAVILKVFHELKFEEIAEIQGAPVSTVKSRLYLAFEKLRSILG
jgi:RNA polymerase sigma-70 factor (ECF subfamily)